MAKVACIAVNQKSQDPRVVFAAVRRAMMLANWQRHVKGGRVVLKVNVVWDKIYPSCTTTPMVIEGIIKVLLASKRFKPSDITIADTDTAAIMNADRSFRIQGLTWLAWQYGVSLVNLSRSEFKTISFKKGLVLRKLKISRVLLEADTIISVPVLKTHAFSQMTGALKNQWGCIHDLRHNYHLVLHEAIADVNHFFHDKIKFALMDGLFGMEGRGPKTGTPRKVGYVFASSDLVAIDTLAAKVMGIHPEKVKHLLLSQSVGVGKMKAEVVGNKVPVFNFKKATGKNIVMGTEMWLRHRGQWLEKALFSGGSPFLFLLCWSAKIYYDLWYRLYGVNLARRMIKTNYGQMWKKHYLAAPTIERLGL